MHCGTGHKGVIVTYMPRQLTTSSGRTRGSWTPRLAGIGAAVLVASGGVAAYLVASPAHAARRTDQLPTRVASVQTVGIVGPARTAGPGCCAPRAPACAGARCPQARASPRATRSGPPTPWPAGPWCSSTCRPGSAWPRCRRRHGPLLALRRCDLDAAQRWQELGGTQASQRQSGQYRNLASRRCLMAGGTAAGRAARPCWRRAPRAPPAASSSPSGGAPAPERRHRIDAAPVTGAASRSA